MLLGGSLPVSDASNETEADKSQIQVISLFKRNTLSEKREASTVLLPSRRFETGSHDHATKHFLSANELVMFSQPSPAHEITVVVAYLKAAAWISRRFFQAK